MARNLRAEKWQSAHRLAAKITAAVPLLEAREDKRKRKEYRQNRKAQFQRPEPGFSLYEGRTRGKRMRYTYDDDEIYGSNDGGPDEQPSRRSGRRNSGASTPADQGPTITASGRQVRSRFGRSYGGEPSAPEGSSGLADGEGADEDDELSGPAPPMRSDDEDMASSEGEADEDSLIGEAEDSSLVVKLKYPKGRAATMNNAVANGQGSHDDRLMKDPSPDPLQVDAVHNNVTHGGNPSPAKVAQFAGTPHSQPQSMNMALPVHDTAPPRLPGIGSALPNPKQDHAIANPYPTPNSSKPILQPTPSAPQPHFSGPVPNQPSYRPADHHSISSASSIPPEQSTPPPKPSPQPYKPPEPSSTASLAASNTSPPAPAEKSAVPTPPAQHAPHNMSALLNSPLPPSTANATTAQRPVSPVAPTKPFAPPISHQPVASMQSTQPLQSILNPPVQTKSDGVVSHVPQAGQGGPGDK